MSPTLYKESKVLRRARALHPKYTVVQTTQVDVDIKTGIGTSFAFNFDFLSFDEIFFGRIKARFARFA